MTERPRCHMCGRFKRAGALCQAPACVMIQYAMLAMALWPLYRAFAIDPNRRINPPPASA